MQHWRPDAFRVAEHKSAVSDMKSTFPRVHQALRADRALRSNLFLTLALILGAAWLAWAFGTHLTRYEVSDSARLEIDSAPFPIQAGASGKLAASYLTLGREVRAGDVLAELDSQAERLSLAGQRTKLAAITPQLAALRTQMNSQSAGQMDEQQVLKVSQSAAQAQYQEANAQALLAEQEWQRANQLRHEGIVSLAEAQRAKASAESKRAAANSLRASAARLMPELQVRERDREIQRERTVADIAKLEAEAAGAAAEVTRLEFEIERRRIRASASGRLGECAVLRRGAHISEGDRLGVILPSGKLQVVAEFEPSAALGKVRPGQTGVLRLQGFPWAQYGVIGTRVSRIADEIRDGKVRVELAVISPIPPRIPSQHGLPGSLEVAVERLTPAALVLRSAGELVGTR